MDKEESVSDTLDQNELVRKVYHTDARVTAMEGEIRQLAGGVSRIENMLLNKPAPNILGWIGAGLVVVSMLAAGLFGIAQYIDLTQQDIRVDVNSRGTVIDEFRSFKEGTHYEMGRIHEWKEQQTRQQQHFDERMHQLESEINRIDSEGSRVWSRGQSQP